MRSAGAGVGAALVMSVEAIEALTAIAELCKLPTNAPTQGMLTSGAIQHLRLQATLVMQAYIRRLLVRARLRRRKEEAAAGKGDTLRLSVLELRVCRPSLLPSLLLTPDKLFCIEMSVGELIDEENESPNTHAHARAHAHAHADEPSGGGPPPHAAVSPVGP